MFSNTHVLTVCLWWTVHPVTCVWRPLLPKPFCFPILVSALQTDRLLQERDFGIYEGCTYEEYAGVAEKAGHEQFMTFSPEGGETNQDITNRGASFLKVSMYRNVNMIFANPKRPVWPNIPQFKSFAIRRSGSISELHEIRRLTYFETIFFKLFGQVALN